MNSAIDYQSLISLDTSKQNAFAYLAAKRAYPTSITFSKKYNFGNPKFFDESIEILHDSIFNSQLSNRLESFLEIIDENAPSTNEFPSFDGTVAQDCGAVFYISIEMLSMDEREQHLSDISTSLTDAVDAYVIEREGLDYADEGFEDIIANHPAMKSEIEAQNGIIAYLKLKSQIDKNDIDYLINWQENKTINLILN